MRNSSTPVSTAAEALRDAPPSTRLELPVAENWMARRPRLPAAVMLERIAETMPWRSTRSGERERRKAQGIPVEFTL